MKRFNKKTILKPKQIIARKFVFYIVVSSFLISILGVTYTVYSEYNSQLNAINDTLENIEKSNYESIINALWVSDEEQINIILKGITQLPYIKSIVVKDAEKNIYSSGINEFSPKPDKNNHIIKRDSLHKDYLGKRVLLGTITIHATLEDLYSNLKKISISALYQELAQILFLLLIFFIVFYKLVGRHLAAMASYARSLKIDALDTPLLLDRSKESKPDELTHLVDAINDMRVNIRSSNQEKNVLVESLAQSEEKFRGIIESAADGVLLANKEGEIELINKAITIMTGYSYEELIGEKVEKIIPSRFSNHIDQRNNYFKTPLIRPMAEDTTLFIKRKDGSEFPVEISLTPVKTNKGIIVAAMIQDVTQRKESENEKEKLLKTLENKNAELERFTYTASHDLKSPLVTISGFIGLLRNDIAAGNAERIESDLNRISDAAKTMQQLLDDLLALSRIGRATMPKVNISLNALIDNVIILLDGIIKSTKANIVVEKDLPNVIVEEQRFKEVFLNLIENAIKYCRDDVRPEITIGTRNDNKKNILYVSDNGIGIQPEYHHKIFGLFDRLDHNIDGNGIGLAIVKRIIEVHDGTVWVESEGKNKGSTFCFTIAEEKQ